MPKFHFQTYSYKNHQNSSALGLADVNNGTVTNASITDAFVTNAFVTTVKPSRLPLLLILLILSSVFLSGCGQKGDLYLVKDAPSNTKFILYDGNKVEGDTAASQAEQAAEQQKIEEAAAAEPQDY
ncbi:LPS translocon maturation chaperone LptM [Psychrobacter phenylpyruvicus]|uniref:Lipoprotein n=1 Tax=Psychrobacter phenylpyruvicus TaxID=29432 RepID=A0A379LM76_9GAMM|nr:lipoprotein [Psychrobacter phenylpyruvicus]SUD91680.1 Uncharacterised protein [Psychrobacter phenylpyruvicus]